MGEANLSSRLITTFNAVTDGDEVMVLVQFWRNRDTIEMEDTAFNSMSDPDAPGEIVLPLSFITVLKSVYDSVWDVDSTSPENGKLSYKPSHKTFDAYLEELEENRLRYEGRQLRRKRT